MILDRDKWGIPLGTQTASAGRPRKGGSRERNGRPQRPLKATAKGKAYIYVLCLPDNGGCKIGYSNDPVERARTIQVGHHLPVRLFWRLEMGAEVARLVEQQVHKELRNTANHLRGEWYAMAPMTAVEVVRNVARSLTAQAKSS
jgi:hypothetical protein